jgi:hypothetical protein
MRPSSPQSNNTGSSSAVEQEPGQRWPGLFFKPPKRICTLACMSNPMTRTEAIRLALDILRPFAESGLYDDYQADEGFSDEQYEAMLAVLHADDPASKQGPWSIFYEAEGNVYRIGPFDNKADAEQAAKNANAEGEYDINDQQVYLIGPDHRMIAISEDDVKGNGDEYDAELAADQLLERQELEDFEGFDPFEGSEHL